MTQVVPLETKEKPVVVPVEVEGKCENICLLKDFCSLKRIVYWIIITTLTVVPVTMFLPESSQYYRTTGVVSSHDVDYLNCGGYFYSYDYGYHACDDEYARFYVTFNYTCRDGSSCSTIRNVFGNTWAVNSTWKEDWVEERYPIGSTHYFYATDDGMSRQYRYDTFQNFCIVWMSIFACILACSMYFFMFEFKEYVDLRLHLGKRGTFTASDYKEDLEAPYVSGASVIPEANFLTKGPEAPKETFEEKAPETKIARRHKAKRRSIFEGELQKRYNIERNSTTVMTKWDAEAIQARKRRWGKLQTSVFKTDEEAIETINIMLTK